ncbi:MAG: DUF2461 domain-containing protein [Muribaculum sp.]|nr:DUF2461 domain-containing protein [Muribaculum sp.]
MNGMEDILNFLRSLREHNDRDWFNDNKTWYQRVKKRVEALASELIAVVADDDPSASGLTAADCTYRIYRDTRFSADKTPYKTHIGIFINPPAGKKSMRCGYYLHIEPDNCFVAAGTVCLPSSLVREIRRSIYDEIDEYRSIVESPEFRAQYSVIGLNLLKTAPKGFPKDWEYIDYVRPKDFCCSQPLPEEFMLRPDLSEALRPAVRQARRFNEFINYTVDEFIERCKTTR